MRPMNRHKPLGPRQPYIKIYTTPEIIEAFARYARSQGRSSSKQGEFLLKQALVAEVPVRKIAANGDC